MPNASRDDKSLLRSQLHRPIFQIDKEQSFHHVEEFIEIIVFVPMIFTLHDTKADHRVIYATQRLVEPGMADRVNDLGQIDYLQVLIANVEVCFVGIRFGFGHRQT